MTLTEWFEPVPRYGFDEATNAKYWITFLVFSVLPAPLSPLNKRKKAWINFLLGSKRAFLWYIRAQYWLIFAICNEMKKRQNEFPFLYFYCIFSSIYLAAYSDRQHRWQRKYVAELHASFSLCKAQSLYQCKLATFCMGSLPRRIARNMSGNERKM